MIGDDAACGDPPWTERHERLLRELLRVCDGMREVSAFWLVTSGIDWHRGVADHEIIRAGLRGYRDVGAAMKAGVIPIAPHSALFHERERWEVLL